jgi:disulfide bond formation protein DsbB
MTGIIQSALPWAVLLSHVVLAYLILALIFRKSWGKDTIEYVGRRALGLSLLTALAAVLGSIFYSSVMGFVPCDLCWWQRIFLFPQVILFLTALKYKDRRVFEYAWRLSALSIIVSIYNIYIQTGGDPLIPCSATSSCTKVYVIAFNYVTIPTMALTVGVYLLLLALIGRKHE